MSSCLDVESPKARAKNDDVVDVVDAVNDLARFTSAIHIIPLFENKKILSALVLPEYSFSK